MKTKFLILGSGIGGLSAAAELKSKGETNFLVVDRCASLPLNLNNGVHYLHSNDFGTPFPFELKQITAVEEVWDPRTDTFKKVSHIPEMMEYSMKVMGTRHPSSIMDPGNRAWKTYLPISNNVNDLIQAYYEYIGKEHFLWNYKLTEIIVDEKRAAFDMQEFIDYGILISTIPMPVMHDVCGFEKKNEFKSTTVYVTNYKTENIVANWLLGIYVSDPKFPPYRITVLNNVISMESIAPLTVSEEHIVKYHLERYFDYSLDSKQTYAWETGRIFGLTKPERESIVKMFSEIDIHLIGRFAQWDGKLLMDTTILQGKELIKKLINK